MTRQLQRLLCAGAVLHLSGFASASAANTIWTLSIKPETSLFAVITQKAGVAARLAHDHLIAAKTFDSNLKVDPLELNKGTFIFKVKVRDLDVDHPELQQKWFPTIQALSWLKQPFTPLKESDRNTIRENMLAENQLNAAKCPEISAEVLKISDFPSMLGTRQFSKKAQVAVTICGKTNTRDIPANINLRGDELQVEAAGDFKFSEFGIKPYKALLGALGNDDQFFILVSFKAVKK